MYSFIFNILNRKLNNIFNFNFMRINEVWLCQFLEKTESETNSISTSRTNHFQKPLANHFQEPLANHFQEPLAIKLSSLFLKLFNLDAITTDKGRLFQTVAGLLRRKLNRIGQCYWYVWFLSVESLKGFQRLWVTK